MTGMHTGKHKAHLQAVDAHIPTRTLHIHVCAPHGHIHVKSFFFLPWAIIY